MGLNVFDVTAKITLDTREYDEGIKDASKQASVFADVLSANLVTKGIGLALDGLKQLGEAAVDTFKQAMGAYADYEQYVGGVETLFQGSADTIKAYAEDAYKNAGISANEYMSLVTSFSGAIIKSTGRGVQTDIEAMEDALDEEYENTKRYLQDQYDLYKKNWDDKIKLAEYSGLKEKMREQRDEELKELKRSHEDQLKEIKDSNKDKLEEAKEYNNQSITNAESLQRAAELSNTAINDMADIANKYGKTVAEVSETYTSLARGNYQTLDNLFGGMFAGTKEGLREMLNYAEEYRAGLGETVTYSENSYADIVSAIHDVSESLGVYGTTAEEAENTITGSLNQVKASWHNLVASLGDENADIEKRLDELKEAVEKWWTNVEPTARRILNNMIDLFYEAIPKFADLGFKIGQALVEGILSVLVSPLAKLFDWAGISGGNKELEKAQKELEEAMKNSEKAAAEFSRQRKTEESQFLNDWYNKQFARRASGGSALKGYPYVAGELGPELVVPSTTSHVYNAEETAGMLKRYGDVNVTIQGDVYDNQYSLRRKMRKAFLGMIETELTYG